MRLRQAARAVVLDPADRILLVRFEFPARTVWAAPGGGIEPGETHEHAIVRELAEEAGLDGRRARAVDLDARARDPVPRRPAGTGRCERYYVLVARRRFEPAPGFTAEQLAAEYVTGMRWWTQEELAASDELFAPRRLPELVAALLRDGPPGEPVDVGV